jgi:hypothetical protein
MSVLLSATVSGTHDADVGDPDGGMGELVVDVLAEADGSVVAAMPMGAPANDGIGRMPPPPDGLGLADVPVLALGDAPAEVLADADALVDGRADVEADADGALVGQGLLLVADGRGEVLPEALGEGDAPAVTT